MKNSHENYLIILMMAFCCFSCGKKSQNAPAVKGPTNKEPITVQLDGGRLDLQIPVGAMAEGTQISATASNQVFPDTGSVLYQFELLPTGTRFNKPVNLTIHYTDEMLGGYSPYNIGLGFMNEEDGKWYALIGGEIDTVRKTISTKITHFSHWAYFSGLHLYTKVNGVLSRDNEVNLPMLTNEQAEVCLVMDLPTLSADDEEMLKILKEVGQILTKDPVNPAAMEDCPDCALFAPVTFTPPVRTDDIHNKIIPPDQWSVNGIKNGSNTIGTITPFVNDVYHYRAPDKMPENNPISIAAVIHTKNHGQLQIVQQVNVYAKKWRWTYAEKHLESCEGYYDLDIYGFNAAMKSYVEFTFKTGFVLAKIQYHNSPWTISGITNCSPNLTGLSIVPEKDIALQLSNLTKSIDFLDYYDYGGFLYLNIAAVYNGNFKVSAVSHLNDGSGKTEPFNHTASTHNSFSGTNGVLIPNTPYDELADKNSKQTIEAIQ